MDRRALAAGLLACSVLAGCREEVGQQPVEQRAAPFRSSQLDQQTEEYITAIRRLDFLLGGADWQQPQQLDKTYLTMWYASYLQLENPQAADILTSYFREGEEGAFFPAEELEMVVEARFGISPEELRRDNLTYREEGVYVTPGPAGELRQYEIDLLAAVREEGELALTFTVSAGEELPIIRRTLILADGPLGECSIYRSLITEAPKTGG